MRVEPVDLGKVASQRQRLWLVRVGAAGVMVGAVLVGVVLFISRPVGDQAAPAAIVTMTATATATATVTLSAPVPSPVAPSASSSPSAVPTPSQKPTAAPTKRPTTPSTKTPSKKPTSSPKPAGKAPSISSLSCTIVDGQVRARASINMGGAAGTVLWDLDGYQVTRSVGGSTKTATAWADASGSSAVCSLTVRTSHGSTSRSSRS
jgi:hypothetical protein